MSTSHGSLENIIMNAVWFIEENNLAKNITVAEVFELINRTDNPRAYTTIKTVMDRLVDKSILKRTKCGKKFSYYSLHSREETAHDAILKLASNYFNDDLNLMSEAVQKLCRASKIYA